jgi:Xaa-Pro aminopeptidase
LAPIDRSLIDCGLMSVEEIGWLDAYHARVREKLSPVLDAETKEWLHAVTRPLGPRA